MIKENRTSKYILYAIGEIILVVIGILIAENLALVHSSRRASSSDARKGGFSRIFNCALAPFRDGVSVGIEKQIF